MTIRELAQDLLDNITNGNRTDARLALRKLSKVDAVAVAAEMLAMIPKFAEDDFDSLVQFLQHDASKKF